ncbi:MAG: outer membrane protein assembly factor BamE [Rhodobacteraceae bacterium]|nr:outer membrane protein assembly factor BamE [Paracoccaceae bacterium]
MIFLQVGRLRLFAATAACLALIACSSTYRNHGYVPTDEQLENILVGVDTQDTVADIIGQPASTGVFAETGWFYISSRVKHHTYHKPEVINRELLAISFDEKGVVSNIERFGLDDGRVITLSRRVTSSGVKSRGFFAQIFGNLGNFNLGDLTDDQ